MRRLITWTILMVLFGAASCKHEIREDDSPTSKTASQDESIEAPMDAVSTAQAWLNASERQGLTTETRPIADSWKDTPPAVIRVFREDGGYFALVGNDSSDRVVPAILLKLDDGPDGWSVIATEPASSDLLWPSI